MTPLELPHGCVLASVAVTVKGAAVQLVPAIVARVPTVDKGIGDRRIGARKGRRICTRGFRLLTGKHAAVNGLHGAPVAGFESPQLHALLHRTRVRSVVLFQSLHGVPTEWGHMTVSIGRRKFIAGLGGSALARPFVARAQQSAPPLIGFLSSTSPDPPLHRVAAFRQGLGEVGYPERGDVVIDFRWAENQAYQLPRMAVELVRRQVAVIATAGGTVSARAAKQATSTIPIVFEIGGDPIAAGLVDQLNRPGGNLTGISMNAPAVGATQLDLLRELVPKASLVAVLSNPNNPNSGTQARVEAAARLYNSTPMRSSSAMIHSSSIGAKRSSRWRRVMQCRQFMDSATMPWPAA
jgi:hypothetical protein